jgi:hypothetical protein
MVCGLTHPIHEDGSFLQLVIPGLTRNPGLPASGGARGDQGFFWIPANERRWFANERRWFANERRWFAFAGMTGFVAIRDPAYKDI